MISNGWVMKQRFLLVPVLALTLLTAGATMSATTPKVLLCTNFGDIGLELYPDQAPVTVENFLWYVEHEYYTGTLFHRVIEGFVIQGGGYFVYDSTIYAIPTNDPIVNESTNGLQNLRGTIAMARSTEADSATSQFYINHVDNPSLDRENASDGIGYCVFGRVISGMDVVDAIAATDVVNIGSGFTHFPYPTIVYTVEAITAPAGYWLKADLDNNGQVNMVDFALFAEAYAGADLLADLDEDSRIDTCDIAEFANQWGQTTDWFE